ncbi:MAG: redoxin domain-containing protein, partial [Moheibacter sp.]
MAKKLFSILLFMAVVSFSFGQESRFPDMILTDIEGNKVDINALSQEGPVAISFWATWCGPCMLELNAINEVIDDWVEETGVKFFAISIDDSKTVSRVRPM